MSQSWQWGSQIAFQKKTTTARKYKQSPKQIVASDVSLKTASDFECQLRFVMAYCLFSDLTLVLLNVKMDSSDRLLIPFQLSIWLIS